MGRAILLLLGTASSVVGMVRIARSLLDRHTEEAPAPDAKKPGRLLRAFLVVVLLGGIALSFYANPLLSAAQKIIPHLGSIP